MMTAEMRFLIVIAVAAVLIALRVWREHADTHSPVLSGAQQHIQLYLFWSQGCAMCGAQKQILESLRSQSADRISVQHVNAAEDRELVARFSVRTVPATVIVTEDGAVERLHGLVPREKLGKLLSIPGDS